ncbi:MAG TPA: LptA/OstA family protein [Candidatus Solibacter sp.]|nr:LptA/OstA family protein [Candidatus Solibacter sp.]
MTLPVYRLRRLLAIVAVLFAVMVMSMYFYARWRTRDFRKVVTQKLGYDIKQTANGFQFSKSDGKRTLFTVQASDVKEFKLNGRAELHNVNIVLYGRDSSRFDQISGDDFSYDPKTGDVTAKGDVQIDLVANPAGLAAPDQSTPKELKNPIHLKTRDLVFNRESGNAWTDAKVEFSTPQASGSATGVRYAGKSNALTLSSQIHLVLSAPHEATIDAEHAVLTGDPREIVLERPRLERAAGTMSADRAVFYLSPANQVERVLASGNVSTETRVAAKAAGGAKQHEADGSSQIRGHAEQAEFLLNGDRNLLHTANLSGQVHFEQTGAQPMQGDAGRVVLDFAGQNQLQKVHALDGAHLIQKGAQKDEASKPENNTPPQDFDLAAPAIDFAVANGHVLEDATTVGAARITIAAAAGANSPAQQTIVTADRFDASFAVTGGRNRLNSVHGAPNARVVSSSTGQPDRISTSDAIDAIFLTQGGVESVTQQGSVHYDGGETGDKHTQAWATNGRYTPADQMLVLTGNPRVASGGMSTTAKTIRLNRATGEATADGEVKSTYSDLKEQPDGALLASASPIHVTARSMSAHKGPGGALYSGNVRLWQDANVIEAPSIEFDRDHRFVAAQGTATQPVQTILSQTEKPDAEKKSPAAAGTSSKKGGSSPISITAAKLTYADAERKIHYEGGVLAKSADFSAVAKTADAFLLPRRQTAGNQSFAGPGQLDRMVAEGDVTIREPKRRADGQRLVYTAADDKFVLTGGPPSIFDAEQGKITGVSLTFFRRDDRVLVEGEASTPVVTTTRVAR